MPPKSPKNEFEEIAQEMSRVAPAATLMLGAVVAYTDSMPAYLYVPAVGLGAIGMIGRLAGEELRRRDLEKKPKNAPDSDHVTIAGKKFSYSQEINGLTVENVSTTDPADAIVFSPVQESYNLDIWRDADGNIPQGIIDAEMLDKAMRDTPQVQWGAFERAVGRILDRKGYDGTFTLGDVEDEVKAEFRRLEQIGRDKELREASLAHEKAMGQLHSATNNNMHDAYDKMLTARQRIEAKKSLVRQSAEERAVRLAQKVIESYSVPSFYMGDAPTLEEDEVEFFDIEQGDRIEVRRASTGNRKSYMVGDGGRESVLRHLTAHEEAKADELFREAQRIARKVLTKRDKAHTRQNMLVEIHTMILAGVGPDGYNKNVAAALMQMNAAAYGPKDRSY